MKTNLIFILCALLPASISAQTLSPATVGQTNNIVLATNHKSLSYGVNHLSVGSEDNARTLNASNVNKECCLNIYPDPADNNLWVGLQFDGEGMAYCLIYDSWGKKITDFNARINASGTITKQLNIAALPTGNYLLSMIFTPVKGDKQTLTKRFEVVH